MDTARSAVATRRTNLLGGPMSGVGSIPALGWRGRTTVWATLKVPSAITSSSSGLPLNPDPGMTSPCRNRRTAILWSMRGPMSGTPSGKPCSSEATGRQRTMRSKLRDVCASGFPDPTSIIKERPIGREPGLTLGGQGETGAGVAIAIRQRVSYLRVRTCPSRLTTYTLNGHD